MNNSEHNDNDNNHNNNNNNMDGATDTGSRQTGSWQKMPSSKATYIAGFAGPVSRIRLWLLAEFVAFPLMNFTGKYYQTVTTYCNTLQHVSKCCSKM